MELTGFSYIVIIFLLFAISRAYLRFRDATVSFRQLIFWLFIWLGAGVTLLYPRNTDDVAHGLGIGRGIDVIVYLSIMLLFYLAFRIYASLNKIEHDATRLVRAIALKDAEERMKKKGTNKTS